MKDLVSRCPIEEVMQVLSGRWPTLLIYYLQEGTKRFSDLRRDNPTISHKMLTLELRKLEEAGIVRRTEFGGYPLRVEYDLTPAGERLVPLIDALGDWWENTDENKASDQNEGNEAAGMHSVRHLRTICIGMEEGPGGFALRQCGRTARGIVRFKERYSINNRTYRTLVGVLQRLTSA